MLKAKPNANVTLTFATNQENGVIMYNGQKHHIAVELFRGRIRVSYDVGNYPVSTMFSYEQVADGEYHVIELLTDKQNFTMRVDGGRSRTIINNGENEYLELDTALYFGGVPRYIGEQASKYWHLRNISSIHGMFGVIRTLLAAFHDFNKLKASECVSLESQNSSQDMDFLIPQFGDRPITDWCLYFLINRCSKSNPAWGDCTPGNYELESFF